MDSVGFNKTLKVVKSVPWSALTNIDKFVANVFGVYLTEGLARTSLNRQTLIKISKTAESLLYTDLVYQEHADLDVNNITVVNTTHAQMNGKDALQHQPGFVRPAV